MKKYGVHIVIIVCGIATSWFLANAIGLFEIPDAYFYVTLGTYLFTGKVAFIAPFNMTIPQTLFAPVYSILSYAFFNYVPLTPIVFIPFFQLFLLFIGTLLMRLILKKLFPSVWVPLGIMIFLLLPFQIIYAFFMMSETVTTFLFTVYVAFLVLGANKSWQKSMLVFTSSFMVLTRFALLPVLGFSLILWVGSFLQWTQSFKLKKLAILALIPAFIGIFCMALWINLHIRLYHAPLLSTYTGRHLYNNVITTGKFIPLDRSNPTIARYYSYFKQGENGSNPWWVLQGWFRMDFEAGKISERDVDRMFLAVSLQGIKEHLPQYILHLAKVMVITPNTQPYHDNVLTQLKFSEPECTTCKIRECRFNWLPQNCLPPSQHPAVLTLFGYWILANRMMYPVLSSVLGLLAFIGICKMVTSRKPTLILIVLIFSMQHVFQSASEWVEGRFMLPLYPLYTILILQGIIVVSKFTAAVTTYLKRPHHSQKIS